MCYFALKCMSGIIPHPGLASKELLPSKEASNKLWSPRMGGGRAIQDVCASDNSIMEKFVFAGRMDALNSTPPLGAQYPWPVTSRMSWV
jgi:hypothetical protein